MEYATSYDVGDRKRGAGINEDSVAVLVFEDGHREGYLGRWRTPDAGDTAATTDGDAAWEPNDDGDAEGTTPQADDLPPGPSSDEDRSDTDRTGETGTAGDGADDPEAADGDGSEDGADGGTGASSEEVGTDGETADEGSVSASDPDSTDADRLGAIQEPGNRNGDGGLPPTRSAAVFALADGAGGHDAGDVASYIASTVVTERLAEVAVRAARSDPEAFDVAIETGTDPLTAADVQMAIREAIVTAHRSILAQAAETGQGAYTTIVAGVAVDGELHYGWVGDSRAYVLNPVHERIERLTKDHSVVTELEDAGEIDEVEAHVHPRGNEITSAIGGPPGEDPETATVPVETHTVPLYAEDLVLVTSDGLIDAQTDAPELHDQYVAAERSDEMADEVLDAVVTDDEILATVLDAVDLDGAAADLVDLANDRGGKDNLSHVLLRDPALGGTPPADRLPTRAIDPDDPIEDRQTVILPDG